MYLLYTSYPKNWISKVILRIYGVFSEFEVGRRRPVRQSGKDVTCTKILGVSQHFARVLSSNPYHLQLPPIMLFRTAARQAAPLRRQAFAPLARRTVTTDAASAQTESPVPQVC
jgi:hypothetical protein